MGWNAYIISTSSVFTFEWQPIVYWTIMSFSKSSFYSLSVFCTLAALVMSYELQNNMYLSYLIVFGYHSFWVKRYIQFNISQRHFIPFWFILTIKFDIYLQNCSFIAWKWKLFWETNSLPFNSPFQRSAKIIAFQNPIFYLKLFLHCLLLKLSKCVLRSKAQ